MKRKIEHTVSYLLRISLMTFWLYVALDKLWGLKAFHISLQRQPFPHWWADILFWLLPVVELGIAVSLLFAGNRFPVKPAKHRNITQYVTLSLSKGLPFFLSAMLLLIFTIYIGLGVAGFYAKRPCGCASVFNSLSWEWHLLVNIVLIIVSLTGWRLERSPQKPSPPTEGGFIPGTKAAKRYPNSGLDNAHLFSWLYHSS